MNKDGFTLIELLAVIVVLAIILVIAVPRVMSVIEESRKESYKLTGELLLRGATSGLNLNSLSVPQEKTYTIIDGEFVGDVIPMNGELPDNGIITVKKNGNTSIAVTKGDYCIRKYEDEKKVSISKDPECVILTPTADVCFTRTNNGTIVTITDYDNTCPKNVVIPSTLDGLPVTIIDDIAFGYNELTSVRIPSSVTTLNYAAFYDNHLTSVTMTNGLTTIGTWVFTHNFLTNISIPSTVTTIGESSFYNNLLTTITIPNSVTTIGDDAFNGNSITSVTIPSNVTTYVDSIYTTFYTAYFTNNARAGGTYTAPSQQGVWTKQ